MKIPDTLHRRLARSWSAYRSAPAGTAYHLARRCGNLHSALLAHSTGDPLPIPSTASPIALP